MGRYAYREVDGVPVVGYETFGPGVADDARAAVRRAWNSISSSGPAALYLPAPEELGNGYVVASGSAGGEPWLLTASVFGAPLSLLQGDEPGPAGFRGGSLEHVSTETGWITVVGHGGGDARVIAVAYDQRGPAPVFKSTSGDQIALTEVPIPLGLKASYRLGYVETSGPGRIVASG
jgi:hypothetical protein